MSDAAETLSLPARLSRRHLIALRKEEKRDEEEEKGVYIAVGQRGEPKPMKR